MRTPSLIFFFSKSYSSFVVVTLFIMAGSTSGGAVEGFFMTTTLMEIHVSQALLYLRLGSYISYKYVLQFYSCYLTALLG